MFHNKGVVSIDSYYEDGITDVLLLSSQRRLGMEQVSSRITS
jgi:hypothetical protein